MDPSSKFDAAALRFSAPFSLELKASGGGLIEGIASTFNGPPDSFGEVVAPGAFRASLARHKAEGTQPVFLWAHDPNQPVGRWDRLEETVTGLIVAGRFNLRTQAGAEAYEHVKARDVTGLSIGFETKAATRGSDGSRILTEIELWEVSLVSLPANRNARITAVKGLITPASLREDLRALGYPSRAAEKIARAGAAELHGKSFEQIEAEELAREIRAISANF